jgi:HAE1 family hydrophobic/amphiphilic exporter-1
VFFEFDICLLLIKRSVRKLFSSAINSSFITGWCVAGAIGFVYLSGLENNIYFQVALIMLIGLLAKNAILIEFAIQRRRNGMDLTKAAIEGALFTSYFNDLVGLHIWFITIGPSLQVGAVGNRSIGMGAVGGMLEYRFGVFVIPVLFVIFQGLQERITGTQ